MSDEQKFVRPEEACRVLKVSTASLKRWATAGKIDFVLTSGGHRRYNLAKYLSPIPTLSRRKICYARVSSSSQKEDLERQAELFRVRYPYHEIIQDVGSGLNFKRKGFKAILELALRGQVQELVVTYKDRLLRFGFELFLSIIRYGHGKIVVLNREQDQTPEQELCSDLIAITTVFTARIHGFRSGKNRKGDGSTVKESKEGKGKGRRGKESKDKNLSEGTSRLGGANSSAK